MYEKWVYYFVWFSIYVEYRGKRIASTPGVLHTFKKYKTYRVQLYTLRVVCVSIGCVSVFLFKFEELYTLSDVEYFHVWLYVLTGVECMNCMQTKSHK